MFRSPEDRVFRRRKESYPSSTNPDCESFSGEPEHIALTANAFDEDVQRSMQAGLNAHLSKPVEPDALFDTLEKMIRP